MKLRLTYIYWMLLCTSVISSTLLFIIVASENAQASKIIGPDRSQVTATDGNVSHLDNPKDSVESSTNEKTNAKLPSILTESLNEHDVKDNKSPDFDKNSEGKIISEAIETLRESLTQQPNLSQGISDSGQPVLLKLTDSNEMLQNLASQSSNEYSEKSAEKNASYGDSKEPSENILRFYQSLEKEKDSRNETAEKLVTSAPEEVVIVRAAKKTIEEIVETPEIDDNGQDDGNSSSYQNISDADSSELEGSNETLLKNQGDLDETKEDSTFKARFAAGNIEDTSTVAIDGLLTTGPNDPHEEIPSFNEWAQKKLEEADKKKGHPNASVQTSGSPTGRSAGSMRIRSKNYASPDCGAKIIAANPESQSTSSIIVSSRDEYMLNTCTSRIWFVVELCEAIEAKKIEIANFELFSSSPKEFTVYVSDRFPTRDWAVVGQFTAKDERDVQSFHIQPQLFGKFIKVELQSHYGSEHFCPISLFRVYGTSEFEMLQTETEVDHQHADSRRRQSEEDSSRDLTTEVFDEEDDFALNDEEETEVQPSSNNLFKSARDAVLSIVKKAAEVLVKTGLNKSNNITKIQESIIRGDFLSFPNSINGCTTPKYAINCKNCSDDRIARVFQFISCRSNYLESLLESTFIYDTLSNSQLCESLNLIKENLSKKRNTKKYLLNAKLLSCLFSPDYVIALCNVLAAKEQKLATNVSLQILESNKNNEVNESNFNTPMLSPSIKIIEDITSTCIFDKATVKSESSLEPTSNILTKPQITPTAIDNQIIEDGKQKSQIKPTKLSTKDEAKQHSVMPTIESSQTEIYNEMTQSLDNGISNIPNNNQNNNGLNKKTITSSLKSSEQLNSQTDARENTQFQVNSQQGPKAVTSGESTKMVLESSSELDSKSEEDLLKVKPKLDFAEEKEVIKATSQDQLNFDNFELKDIDVESLQNNGGGSNSASVVEPKINTPQQKESVFLRLSNRIKALERNMSLSSQYLEELSKRYKKQVEEMQRSLERAVTAMNDESRKRDEKEYKRIEEIDNLKGEIKFLTKSMEELLYERNSWHIRFSTICQHFIFIMVDVIIVILILSYCRRSDDLDYEDQDIHVRFNNNLKFKKFNRGKTYEIIKESIRKTNKKHKVRRPSEIASHISASYNQLLINDNPKKEKRRKRRREISLKRTASNKECRNYFKDMEEDSDTIPRSASTNDALYSLGNNNSSNNLSVNSNYFTEKPDSAPIYFNNLSTDHTRIQILKSTVEKDREPPNNLSRNYYQDDGFILDELKSTKDEDNGDNSAGIFFDVKKNSKTKISSPSFLKTALGSRSKRKSYSVEEPLLINNKSNSEKISNKLSSLAEVDNENIKATNGHNVEESDESRTSIATPSSAKKEKKTNGLKKMKRVSMG